MGVSQNHGYLFGGPNNKDYSFFGLYWGPLILGNYHIVVVILTQVIFTTVATRVWSFDLGLLPLENSCMLYTRFHKDVYFEPQMPGFKWEPYCSRSD